MTANTTALPPICGRHGGPWGDDETCEDCTYDNGMPVLYPNEDDDPTWLTQSRLAQATSDALDALVAAAYDVAGRFTCDEAEQIAALFVAADRPEDAASWLLGHADSDDDEGDRHSGDYSYADALHYALSIYPTA